ncbi:MAG TPA: TlpA disulfide reductase family protein [Ignavibacteriales bacterium]|nr:TlpA disulfide reductase family protein [Ignavibacteriales bacterium]
MKLLFPFLYIIALSGNLLFAQKTVITGRVLGSDNMPMAKAGVSYFDNAKKNYVPVNVTDEGSFRYETSQSIVSFQFSGANHRTVFLPVYLNKSAELKFDILLPALNYKNNIETDPARINQRSTGAVINSEMPECPEIKVIKEDLKRQNYYDEMKERVLKDSTFIPDLKELARVVKNDLEKEKNSFVRGYHCFKYLSLLRDMHVFSYVSEERVKNMDSSLLVNALNEINPSSPFWSYNFNMIYAIGSPYQFIKQREKYDEYIDKVILLHKDQEVIAEALWSKAEWIKNEIKQKRNLLENPRLDRKEVTEMATRIIKEYKEKNNLNDEQMKAKQEEVSQLIGAEYRILLEKKKKEINMSSPEIMTANEDFLTQENLSRQCLERITAEFPNTFRGKMIKNEFLTLRRDDQVPEFELNVMDSSNIRISNNSMKGKYYLLDFWASWCGPCMGNMPDLHEVYKKLKDKNFEIISISLDENDDAVRTFKKEKYPMPWLHTRLVNGFEDPVARKFGVGGIPKMLLISPEGKILANNWDLHGQYFVEKIVKMVNGENP